MEELSSKADKKLLKWMKSKYYGFLSIGELIEFLDEHVDSWIGITKGRLDDYWVVNNRNKKKELCDALWDAVKEILEK